MSGEKVSELYSIGSGTRKPTRSRRRTPGRSQRHRGGHRLTALSQRHRHRSRPRHPGMRRPASQRRPASKSAIARTTTGCVSLVEATPRGNGGEPGLGCGGPGEARSTDGTCGRATTPGGPEHSAGALLQSTLGRTPTGSEESSYELVD